MTRNLCTRWWRLCLAVVAGMLVATSLPTASVADDPFPEGTPTGKVEEFGSPGHLQVRLKGRAADPSPGADPSVPLVIFIHDAEPPDAEGNKRPGERHEGPDLRTRPDGTFDLTITTRLGGRVQLQVYAVNQGTGKNLYMLDQPLTVLIDTIPPVTTFTSYPPSQVEVEPGATRSVPFTFVSNEAGSSFTCNLDGNGWESCVSPTSVQVGVGDHELQVRAMDPAGVQGQPVSYRFAVVPAAAVAPPPPVDPTAPAAALAVQVKAVKRKSRLRVRVSPASAEVDYRFVVQRKAGKKWRKVKRSVTRKAKDRKVLDLRRGRYRVLVPAQHGMAKARSKAVRLRR